MAFYVIINSFNRWKELDFGWIVINLSKKTSKINLEQGFNAKFGPQSKDRERSL